MEDPQDINEVSDVESNTSSVRRSQRESRPVERLEPSMQGQSYLEAT